MSITGARHKGGEEVKRDRGDDDDDGDADGSRDRLKKFSHKA